MNITIIGVEPPCPRCARMYDLAVSIVNELGLQAEVAKISYDSNESEKFGRVGTAHDIAQLADFSMDWSKIKDIVVDGWTRELDDFLMPCAEKARENGWLMTPVLAIDEEVVCMGYVPDKEYIKNAIVERMETGGAEK